MTLRIAPIPQTDIAASLEDLARLRIEVFRAFPYLYDGDMEYEKRYLAALAESPNAVIIGAWDQERLVGAATGAPMQDHADEFAAAFSSTGHDLDEMFYCAESVLLPGYRGQGAGHAFFDQREAAARRMGLRSAAFCAVLRPADHPARPTDYRPLDRFWRKRGYTPLPDVIAHFAWRDLGAAEETEKPLQFWMRRL